MKTKTLLSVASLLLVTLLGSNAAHAGKKSAPSGWKQYNWGTDQFNDYDLGWQWYAGTHNVNSKLKDGSQAWSKFRAENLQFTGSNLKVVNWYHTTPVTEGGITFHHSGGWLAGKADWLREGQYQARTKVDWNYADIWPAFWTWKNVSEGSDELDVFEYQSDILNHAHHIHYHNPNSTDHRQWGPWHAAWEYNWAMARVRSWTHWAGLVTNSISPTFYIEGKQEFVSSLGGNPRPMHLLMTSSPHKNHLPAAGNYPNFNVDWVETYIP